MPTFWIREPQGHRSETIAAEEIVAGRGDAARLQLDDPRVSRAHFSIRFLGGTWFIKDLHSGNGTVVNGVRIHEEIALRDRDVIVAGDTSVTIGLPAASGESTVLESIPPPPLLTPREQEVLGLLCEPLLGPDPYAEPTSVRVIADRLFITPDAVKKCLARLYSKFEVGEHAGTRRLLLARQAILSQAVRPPG